MSTKTPVPKGLVPLAHCSGRQAMKTSDSGGIASMTLESTERRCYSRTQLRSKKLVSLQGTGPQNFYSCKNVGLGGMLIEGLEPMAVGSMVRFAVRIGMDTVRGLAAIRRATPNEMGIDVYKRQIPKRIRAARR